MAAASNCIVGHRDFQMMSVRRISSYASTSSAIDMWKTGIPVNGHRFKGCLYSDNFGNELRSTRDLMNGRACVNGVKKAKTFDPFVPRVLRVSEEVVNVDDQQKNLDRRIINGGTNRGNTASYRNLPSREKIMIAVDVDEVLGRFLSALNEFIADRYSQNHSISEYHVYEFFKIWNCSRDEADIRVHEFFKTPLFKSGINPIPGAREALEKLSEKYNLSIVTSRQNTIKEHTIDWVEKHYPGLFQEIRFGNHFALDGKSKPKSEICKSLGARVLIDDNPRYAMECAEMGIKVLLFDYENSYPWCKTEHAAHRHPLVTKVHGWEEVEDQLTTWVLH